MVVLSLLGRSLLLVTLITTSAHGSPVDTTSGSTTPCAAVKCSVNTTCRVIDGKPQCVPIHGVPCGNTVCETGMTCCNPSCGVCTNPGMACTAQICSPSIPTNPPPAGEQCGSTFCKAGQECCNASCGICVEPGKGCTKQFCIPNAGQCGKVVCPAGLVCCNASCGICTTPDGACTQQFCTDTD